MADAADEPLPCPSCGAMLRLPPGATSVRCPGCQAVLDLDDGDAPPEPPPPPP
jgi:LSD1 subclass zinc finger protein